MVVIRNSLILGLIALAQQQAQALQVTSANGGEGRILPGGEVHIKTLPILVN